MNCLEFRRHVGAEPFSTNASVASHRAACAACARHQDELQAMDRLLAKAMRVDWAPGGDSVVREGTAASRTTLSVAPPAATGRRWYALAASLVVGMLVAATMWVSWPRQTLAAEVIEHALHEPQSWTGAQPVPVAAVAGVLDTSGTRLRPGAGEVTFARRCFFRGHWVPHLVVQTGAGPVTVFLLGHRTVDAAMTIEAEGFSAVVLPAPRGSIAVVGRGVAGMDEVARKVFEYVAWEA